MRLYWFAKYGFCCDGPHIIVRNHICKALEGLEGLKASPRIGHRIFLYRLRFI